MPHDDVRFHDALRDAIERRGLPLERVSAHLRARGHTISIATLSYWQSGRSAPSRSSSIRALGALEEVLGTARGELARRVFTPADCADRPQAVRMAAVDAQMAVVDELVRDLGRTMDDTVQVVTAHWRSFVDEERAILYGHVREVIRALVPQPNSYVTCAWHPVAGQDVVITALTGCAVRNSIARVEESVCVAEMSLPALARGGLHVVEYEIGFPTFSHRVGCDRAIACITSPMRELVIEVSFPPDAVPGSVRRLEGDTAEGEPTRTLVYPQYPSLTIARTNFGPGVIGLEWGIPGA